MPTIGVVLELAADQLPPPPPPTLLLVVLVVVLLRWL